MYCGETSGIDTASVYTSLGSKRDTGDLGMKDHMMRTLSPKG
jgi:hypothetical protein